MPRALEVTTAVATPATATAGVALTGNSLTVRDAPTNKKIMMVAEWSTRQAVGDWRISSPLMHDTSVGIQSVGAAGPQIGFRFKGQEIHPQDTISVNIVGGGAGDLAFVSWLAYFEDLPGVSARLITWEELMRRAEDLYSFANTLTTTSTTGQYTGSEAISAEQDQLKANRDYALLGCNVHSTVCHLIGYSGVDFGNLRVAVPGPTLANDFGSTLNTNMWFADLAKLLNLPLIPVFNASNKTLTTIDAVVDENAGDPVVSTLTCLLN